MLNSQPLVMVFGTFDGFHKGHRNFLKQARALGEQLIAVVARDTTVQQLKQKKPRHKLQERIDALEASSLVDKVIPGDEIQNTWDVIHAYKPEVIALGYDQDGLYQALKQIQESFSIKFELKRMKSYKPAIYHSRLLKKNNP